MMKLLKRLLCPHTHGRLVAIELDGTSVHECSACGKRISQELRSTRRDPRDKSGDLRGVAGPLPERGWD
jgi:hypothetical protein